MKGEPLEKEGSFMEVPKCDSSLYPGNKDSMHIPLITS